ncbi:MAG: heavy metal translocating P-type ATPase [Halothiobacillaceae bacterium]
MNTQTDEPDAARDADSSQACFHCGSPVPDGSPYAARVLGESRPMCCPGCEAVARAIVDGGMEDYYRHRTDVAERPEGELEDLLAELKVFDRPEMQKSFVANADGDMRDAALILEGIVCAACVWLSERHVTQIDGVDSFSVNLSTHRAQVRWDNRRVQLSTILKAIAEIGYRAHPYDPNRQDAVFKRERHRLLRHIAVAGLGYMQIMMIAMALYIGDFQGIDDNLRYFFWWVSLIIAIPIIFYSASTFYRSAWRDLKQRRVSMDLPVSVSILLAFGGSVWATVTNTGEIYYDTVTMFVFLLLGGRYLEMSARHKTGAVTESLIKLLPGSARRLLSPTEEEVVPVFELRPGDRIRVRPGDTLPADGRVVAGESTVNASMLTGESVPEPKSAGARVAAGTVNVESPLEVEVEQVGQDTMLSSIVRLMDRAQAQRPRIAETADHFARRFVALLFLVTALVVIAWLFIDPSRAFWIAVAILAITCPCSLSLATPTAVSVATGRLTRAGLLVTRGHALETLAQATHVVFDKTGTLSAGRLAVVDVAPAGDMDRVALLSIAAGLEQGSEHPVAEAIFQAWTDTPGTQIRGFDELRSRPGQGMEGNLDGVRYRLGTAAFAGALAPIGETPPERAEILAIHVVREGQFLGTLFLEDRLREDAADTVAALKAQGVTPMLLSGDTPARAEAVARQVGIDHWQGAALPEDKLATVRKLQEEGAVVVMIGDGVNDAPVLSQAQVSIAMGGGTSLAQTSADMVLINDHLTQVGFALGYARRTMSIIRQNLRWSMWYNAIAIPLAAVGFVQPWLAAIGMSASSIIVILNALRLRRD